MAEEPLSSSDFFQKPLREIASGLLDILEQTPDEASHQLLEQYAQSILEAGIMTHQEPHIVFACSLLAASSKGAQSIRKSLNPDSTPFKISSFEGLIYMLNMQEHKEKPFIPINGDVLGLHLAMSNCLARRWGDDNGPESNAALALRPLLAFDVKSENLKHWHDLLESNNCMFFKDTSVAIVGSKEDTLTDIDPAMPEWRSLFKEMILFNDPKGRLDQNRASENTGRFDYVISSDVLTYPGLSKVQIALWMDDILKQGGHHVHITSISPTGFSFHEMDQIFGLENVVYTQAFFTKEGIADDRAMIFPKLLDLKRLQLEARRTSPYL